MGTTQLLYPIFHACLGCQLNGTQNRNEANQLHMDVRRLTKRQEPFAYQTNPAYGYFFRGSLVCSNGKKGG